MSIVCTKVEENICSVFDQTRFQSIERYKLLSHELLIHIKFDLKDDDY